MEYFHGFILKNLKLKRERVNREEIILIFLNNNIQDKKRFGLVARIIIYKHSNRIILEPLSIKWNRQLVIWFI